MSTASESPAKMPWWGRALEMVVVTVCCVSVLMLLASKPDFDELYKGTATGMAAFFVGRASSVLFAKQ